MTAFDFITHRDFRASLESDYEELGRCLRSGAWKAAHVLAGSIIEALLIDSLLAHQQIGLTEDQILKLDLSGAITKCEEKRIISKKSADLSSVVRSYRNLIHPGRMIRLGEVADEDGAKVAAALVDIIVKEVAALRRTTYGFTAEQIVSKIERDPGSPILEHLLKEVNPEEMERLLTNALPSRYIELEQSPSPPNDTLAALKQAFRAAFTSSPPDLKTRVVTRFVSTLKEESGATIDAYQAAFVRGSDLNFLSESNKPLVIGHLLAKMQPVLDPDSLDVYEGIGPFLRPDEVSSFVDSVVRLAVTPRGEAAVNFLVNEYSRMSEGQKAGVEGRLTDWIEHFKNRSQSSLEETIRQLKDSLVPF